LGTTAIGGTGRTILTVAGVAVSVPTDDDRSAAAALLYALVHADTVPTHVAAERVHAADTSFTGASPAARKVGLLAAAATAAGADSRLAQLAHGAGAIRGAVAAVFPCVAASIATTAATTIGQLGASLAYICAAVAKPEACVVTIAVIGGAAALAVAGIRPALHTGSALAGLARRAAAIGHATRAGLPIGRVAKPVAAILGAPSAPATVGFALGHANTVPRELAAECVQVADTRFARAAAASGAVGRNTTRSDIAAPTAATHIHTLVSANAIPGDIAAVRVHVADTVLALTPAASRKPGGLATEAGAAARTQTVLAVLIRRTQAAHSPAAVATALLARTIGHADTLVLLAFLARRTHTTNTAAGIIATLLSGAIGYAGFDTVPPFAYVAGVALSAGTTATVITTLTQSTVGHAIENTVCIDTYFSVGALTAGTAAAIVAARFQDTVGNTGRDALPLDTILFRGAIAAGTPAAIVAADVVAASRLAAHAGVIFIVALAVDLDHHAVQSQIRSADRDKTCRQGSEQSLGIVAPFREAFQQTLSARGLDAANRTDYQLAARLGRHTLARVAKQTGLALAAFAATAVAAAPLPGTVGSTLRHALPSHAQEPVEASAVGRAGVASFSLLRFAMSISARRGEDQAGSQSNDQESRNS